MKEQKKEKIAILTVLLFILSYLIIWDYDKLIKEPRETIKKDKSLNYMKFKPQRLLEWESSPAVATSAETLEVLTSTSNEIYLDCTAEAQEIEQEESIEQEEQVRLHDKRFETTAYYIMPKSVDLLIKDAFFVEKDKEEIYKLIWEWQGYKYDAEKEMIILPNLYYDDLLYIKAVENFIEWLYENDYEIVKKD